MLLFLLLWLADPQQASSLLRQGLVAMQHGQITEARKLLEQASHADERNAYVWTSLAEVYLRLKDSQQSKAAVEKAEQLGANDPLVCHALAMYYSETNLPARAAPLEQKFAESSKADPAAFERVGSLFLAAGQDERAVPFLRKAWEANQSDERITFSYVNALLRTQAFTDAADAVTTALQKHNQDVQLELLLGVARYGQRRFDDAVSAFLQVIKLDPEVEQPYLFLGRLLEQATPHLAEIISADREWARRNPRSSKAQLELAKALLQQNRNDSEAQALLRSATSLDDKDWEAHYQLGVLLEGKREFAAAAEELEKSTSLDPKQPLPHYHLARVYDRLGDALKAASERALHASLTANEKNPY